MAGLTVLPAQQEAVAGTTPLSTFTKTGTDVTHPSTATSSTPGTAQPGDTITWALNYQNTSGASANVSVADPITGGQTYVPNSLHLPPGLTGSVVGNTLTASGTVNAGTTDVTSPPFSLNTITFNTPGGDGYTVNGYLDRVYTVFHHNGTSTQIFCATLSNQICPGWPAFSTNVDQPAGSALGSEPAGEYTTGMNSGSFIVNGKLYFPTQVAVPGATTPVGIQCLDLTTNLSCGFTQLDTAPSPGAGAANIGGSSLPAANGNYYYVDGNGTLLCFNPATGPCGTAATSGAFTPDLTREFAPYAETFGSYVFGSFTDTNNKVALTCYNTATSSNCAGYPFELAAPPSLNEVASLVPVYTSAGALTGVCLSDFQASGSGAPGQGSCFDLTGQPVANPYPTTTVQSGSSLTIGTKVYTTSWTSNVVQCFDFSKWSGTGTVPACAGFTPPASPAGYTVRALPNLLGCGAADGDAGQIVVFNLTTGAPCDTANTSVTLTPSQYYCDGQAGHISSWGAVSLPGLTAADYAGATLTLLGADGTAVPGWMNVPFPSSGPQSINISAIPVSGNTTTLTAQVNIAATNNQAVVAGATTQLSWVGDPIQVCYQTVVPPVACLQTATVSNDATAITTAGAATDAPGNGTGAVSFLVAPSAAQCMLQLNKTATPSPALPGDTVTYTVTVTNTGTQDYVAANPASFTDDLSAVLTDATYNNDAAASTGSASYSAPTLSWSGALAAGATATITYTVTVKSPDTGNWSMTNTVLTPAGTPSNCGSGSTNTACTATVPIQVSQLTLVKSASPSDAAHYTVGQQITYSFVVTNTGNTTLSNLTVADSTFTGSGSLSAISCPTTTVAPLQQVTCTATYMLTQADIDRGSTMNTATATGTPPTGAPVSSTPSQVTIPGQQNPALELVKSASPATVTAAGQTVTYSFQITNTGNVTVSNLGVTEDAFSGSGAISPVSCPPGAASLVPGAIVTCTATYVVTQADVDAGTINNTATASGKDPSGAAVTSPTSTATVPIKPAGALDLVKAASPATVTAAGQTVTYTFTVKNIGNVTVSKLAIAETSFSGTGTLSAISCPTTSLAPGASTTCTATYVVTQADADAGQVTNTAVADSTDPSGAPVSSPSSTATVTVTQDPGITVAKSASPSDAAHYTVGQQITYSFVVTNAGNTTLTKVAVDDSTFTGSGSLSAITCPSTTLAPSQQVTCTATYTLTQADVDAGKLSNTATATGTSPTGATVTSPPSQVTIPAQQNPSLTLAKTADKPAVAAAGESITYTFHVTNTGNVTVTDPVIQEGTFTGTGTLSAISCPPAPITLAPGKGMDCTATYMVTAADLNGQPIKNTATVTAKAPGGATTTSAPSTATVDTPGATVETGGTTVSDTSTGWWMLWAAIGLLLLAAASTLIARRPRR